DDSALGAADVEVRSLDEAQQDVLDVLAHVAGLGETGGVGDGEWHVEDLGECLRQVSLAAACRAHQQHVGLRQLHVADRLRCGDALVVVVDLDRQHLLGAILPDHVLVEGRADRLGVGDEAGLLLLLARGTIVVLEDLLAEVDALVADEDARPRDELAYLVLTLAAERAAGVPAAILSFVHWYLVVLAMMSIKTMPAPGACGPREFRSRHLCTRCR